jgi:hypothetical protein
MFSECSLNILQVNSRMVDAAAAAAKTGDPPPSVAGGVALALAATTTPSFALEGDLLARAFQICFTAAISGPVHQVSIITNHQS